MESLLQLFHLLNKNDVVSLDMMMDHLGSSERKVRALLGELRRLGRRHGFEVTTLLKSGYSLKISNQEKFDAFSETHSKQQLDFSNRTIRLHNIILFLMNLQEEYSNIDELAALLEVTRPTIVSDLKVVKEMLESYELTFISRPRYGIRIEGKEINKRRLLSQLFTEGIEDYSGLRYFTKEEQEAIQRIVYISLYENQLYFNDPIFYEIVAHVEVFIMRIYNAEESIKAEINGLLIDEASFASAGMIMSALQDQFGVPESPKEEQLLALNIFVMTNSTLIPKELEDLYEIAVKQTLIEIDVLYGSYFAENERLVKRLTYHVYALMIRLSYKFQLKNPNHSLIGLKHLFPNLLSVDFVRIHPYLNSFQLTRDELSLLSLHFAAAMNDQKNLINYSIRNVLLGTNLLQSNAAFIGSRLRTIFPNADVTSRVMKQVEQTELDKYDLVLLTERYGYTERETKALVWDFNPIPTDMDLQRLNRAVIYRFVARVKGTFPRLQDVLFDNLFFVEDNEELSYKEIVSKYATRMVELKYASIGFEESVMHRERIGSSLYATGIGGAHAMNEFTIKNSIGIVIVPNSKHGVKFIFIFNVKRRDYPVYQEIAELYPALLQHPHVLSVTSYETFLMHLKELI